MRQKDNQRDTGAAENTTDEEQQRATGTGFTSGLSLKKKKKSVQYQIIFLAYIYFSNYFAAAFFLNMHFTSCPFNKKGIGLREH